MNYFHYYYQAVSTGPYTKTIPQCLGCCRTGSLSYLCPGCRFPLCQEECAEGQHMVECKVFSKAGFKAKVWYRCKIQDLYFDFDLREQSMLIENAFIMQVKICISFRLKIWRVKVRAMLPLLWLDYSTWGTRLWYHFKINFRTFLKLFD